MRINGLGVALGGKSFDDAAEVLAYASYMNTEKPDSDMCRAFMLDLACRSPKLLSMRPLPGRPVQAYMQNGHHDCDTILVEFSHRAVFPVSLRECVSPSFAAHPQKMLTAARNEVSDYCRGKIHDETLPISKIYSDFIEADGGHHPIPFAPANGLHLFFADRLLAEKWKTYHKQIARLRVIKPCEGQPHGFFTAVQYPSHKEIQMPIEDVIAKNTAALEALTAALAKTGAPEAAKAEAAKAEAPKPVKAAKAKVEAPASAAAEDDGMFDDEPAKPATRDEVKTALIALKDAKGADMARKALAAVGATSLGTVNEGKLGELLAKIKELG